MILRLWAQVHRMLWAGSWRGCRLFVIAEMGSARASRLQEQSYVSYDSYDCSRTDGVNMAHLCWQKWAHSPLRRHARPATLRLWPAWPYTIVRLNLPSACLYSVRWSSSQLALAYQGSAAYYTITELFVTPSLPHRSVQYSFVKMES